MHSKSRRSPPSLCSVKYVCFVFFLAGHSSLIGATDVPSVNAKDAKVRANTFSNRVFKSKQSQLHRDAAVLHDGNFPAMNVDVHHVKTQDSNLVSSHRVNQQSEVFVGEGLDDGLGEQTRLEVLNRLKTRTFNDAKATPLNLLADEALSGADSLRQRGTSVAAGSGPGQSGVLGGHNIGLVEAMDDDPELVIKAGYRDERNVELNELASGDADANDNPKLADIEDDDDGGASGVANLSDMNDEKVDNGTADAEPDEAALEEDIKKKLESFKQQDSEAANNGTSNHEESAEEDPEKDNEHEGKVDSDGEVAEGGLPEGDNPDDKGSHAGTDGEEGVKDAAKQEGVDKESNANDNENEEDDDAPAAKSHEIEKPVLNATSANGSPLYAWKHPDGEENKDEDDKEGEAADGEKPGAPKSTSDEVLTLPPLNGVHDSMLALAELLLANDSAIGGAHHLELLEKFAQVVDEV